MNRKRPHQVKVYLSESEREKFDKLVAKSKLNKSEYMRKKLLDEDVIVIEDIKELMKELKAIGNNLNQLTRIANTERQIGNLRDMQEELSEVWDKVIEVLKRVND